MPPLLGVGHSAFYDWLRQGHRRATERDRLDRERVEVTRQAWAEHRGVYGARRLTAELRERGHRWIRKAVARLMRLAGIEGAHRRRRGNSAARPRRPRPPRTWSSGSSPQPHPTGCGPRLDRGAIYSPFPR
ncbi:IS3 family transposase [Polymorphospora sp. NPDC050346]|uniref:IS3 family transposase n=1 Tax=Polymorphospora sp. NPDC050346 TaxID=3155780 RepID=UPI0033F41B16